MKMSKAVVSVLDCDKPRRSHTSARLTSDGGYTRMGFADPSCWIDRHTRETLRDTGCEVTINLYVLVRPENFCKWCVRKLEIIKKERCRDSVGGTAGSSLEL